MEYGFLERHYFVTEFSVRAAIDFFTPEWRHNGGDGRGKTAPNFFLHMHEKSAFAASNPA